MFPNAKLAILSKKSFFLDFSPIYNIFARFFLWFSPLGPRPQ